MDTQDIYSHMILWIYLFIPLGIVSVVFLSMVDERKTEYQLYKMRKLRKKRYDKNLFKLSGSILLIVWVVSIAGCIADFKLFH